MGGRVQRRRGIAPGAAGAGEWGEHAVGAAGLRAHRVRLEQRRGAMQMHRHAQCRRQFGREQPRPRFERLAGMDRGRPRLAHDVGKLRGGVAAPQHQRRPGPRQCRSQCRQAVMQPPARRAAPSLHAPGAASSSTNTGNTGRPLATAAARAALSASRSSRRSHSRTGAELGGHAMAYTSRAADWDASHPRERAPRCPRSGKLNSRSRPSRNTRPPRGNSLAMAACAHVQPARYRRPAPAASAAARR